MANDLKVNSTVIGIMLGHRSEKTTKKYVKAMPLALIAIAAHMRERSPSSVFANAMNLLTSGQGNFSWNVDP